MIIVDEAQFFPDLHDFCEMAVDDDHKTVIVAGLSGDFRRQKFGQVQHVDVKNSGSSMSLLTILPELAIFQCFTFLPNCALCLVQCKQSLSLQIGQRCLDSGLDDLEDVLLRVMRQRHSE